jgi:hypothetical protein
MGRQDLGHERIRHAFPCACPSQAAATCLTFVAAALPSAGRTIAVNKLQLDLPCVHQRRAVAMCSTLASAILLSIEQMIAATNAQASQFQQPMHWEFDSSSIEPMIAATNSRASQFQLSMHWEFDSSLLQDIAASLDETKTMRCHLQIRLAGNYG